MSEEKPPEAPSAPLRPYLKKSERKGCVFAMLSVFIIAVIAGLIYIGVSQNSMAVVYLTFTSPIWLMLWVVIGVVCLGNMRKSSNQEEGNLKKSGRKGCVPLIYLCVILFPLIVYFFQVIFGG